MNVESGEYSIIESGTVIAAGSNPVVVNILEAPLKFIFTFIDKRTSKESITELVTIDSKTLEFKITINDARQSIGNTELIHVGYSGNRKLYVNYRVLLLEGVSHVLIYTFYLGKEDPHG